MDYTVAVKSIVPLRKDPSDSSERVDEILLGMTAQILSQEGSWYYIRTFYNYEGYVDKKNVIVISEGEEKRWKKEASFYVSQSSADVLKEPKFNSPIIVNALRGTFLKVTGETSESWSKVVLPDGKCGWIYTHFIKKLIKYDLSYEEKIRENLVKTAEMYMSTQYRWGGKSPLGIDCSGLCFMAYLLNGFVIFRDAELKEEYMKKISFDNIKKGDLVYFPGHVAMYTGNGKYIHSNGKSHCVAVNSFNKEDNDYRSDLANSILGIGSIF